MKQGSNISYQQQVLQNNPSNSFAHTTS